MMSGEYAAMSLIHKTVPDFVPRPIDWGTYSTIPDVHFFISEFRSMTSELPDLTSFPAQLAMLHREGTSSDGKFGFSTTSFHGNTPLNHGWADTWEEYFTTRTKTLIEMEQEAQGPCQEILDLAEPFFNKVVPRLLRPLETGGRHIRPSLIHGDLWHGNATMDADNERPIIFDAASFYAHNEYELGVWRADWNKIGQSHVKQYHMHFPISPPEEDHDDRNLLYATRVNILDSILYKRDSEYREQLIADMRKLVAKYPEGYEGWLALQQDGNSNECIGS
jgi:protein-ribulosamine 3-kinase